MGRLIVRTTFFLLASMVSLSSAAQLLEGRDYIELSPPQPTNDPSRIVATEFFFVSVPALLFILSRVERLGR